MKNVFFVLFIFLTSFSYSQRNVSADVEIKQVAKGKVFTIKKSIYYQSSGKLVVHFTVPEEYFIVTNSFGETKAYIPSKNEVTVFNDKTFSSENELLYYFFSNKIDDLGLKELGFTVTSIRTDNDNIVKTYTSDKNEYKNISKIEMVYENYLPVYCAYFNPKGEITRKIYYSNYSHYSQLTLPTRITEIVYNSPVDSIVKREIYSNIKLNNATNNTLFEYEVPASAKFITTPNNVKK